MKKVSKASTAVLVGLVGVLALGACSSSSDQAESDRNAAQGSASQASQSPEAAVSPTAPVKLPASAAANFKDVKVTHAKPSSCSSKELKDRLVINCTSVGANVIGDQVYVYIPGQHFEVNFRNLSGSDGRHSWMQTTQRNWAYVGLRNSSNSEVAYGYPYPTKGETPWGVGVEGKNEQIDVEITVVKA